MAWLKLSLTEAETENPHVCAIISPKNKQMAHNQVYNRQIALRPSQHLLVLPSMQSA